MTESILLIFLVVVAIAGLIVCNQIEKELKNIFSEENIYRECRNEGFTHEESLTIIEKLKPEVGEPGLPAWESKKRNLE